jgi:hypothetical protein
MFQEEKTYLRPTGDRFISWSVGGSVANARAPSVSMMRLTQRSCIQNKGKLAFVDVQLN